MSGERVKRRLAAILAADVAGYSRLMGQDEAGTLARLRAHRRELIDPKIADHKGRIVKTTGDGLLLEFPSVVEAVACAVAVQHGMAGRNAGTPEEQRIVFRVGINLGDVIVEAGGRCQVEALRQRLGAIALHLMPRWSRCAIVLPLLVGRWKRRPGDKMALEIEGVTDAACTLRKRCAEAGD